MDRRRGEWGRQKRRRGGIIVKAMGVRERGGKAT